MKEIRRVIGSLIYNQDIGTYVELQGLDTFDYFPHQDYADFYEEVLLPLYRQGQKPPSIKAVKHYINNHSHKSTYKKILNASLEEVKSGKKIIASEDMETFLDVLKKKNLKTYLQEEVEELSETLEESALDNLEECVDSIKELALTSEGVLKQDKDEELLLHESVGAQDIFREKYNKRKEQGGTKVCDYGYTFLDDTFGGIKTSDMFSILGSAKQFKSTLQRNIAYKVILQARNVFMATLEMSFDEIETSMLTLHVNNRTRFPDFPRITYKQILEGKVPKEHESYMFEAYNDLVQSEDLGILYIFKPIGDYTEERFKSDIARVESKYMKIDLACVDSVNLMHGGAVEEVDKAIRGIRQHTLGYNKNKGLPFSSPYQIKRSAFEQACNAEGNLYTTDAVRYFSEVNTSSTRVITSIQTPEMRETSTVQIQCLLSRDTEDFPPTLLRVDGEIGVLEEIDSLVSLQEEGELDSATMDEIISVTSSNLFD